MEKVIFDTNTIRNADHNSFLGGTKMLEQFAAFAEIVIPEIVIEELNAQKVRKLISNREKFIANPYHDLCRLNAKATRDYDIDLHVSSLAIWESINYHVIKLTDYSVLTQMKALAIKKQPPFEPGENTDKGFKDAYIYFTILEYLQSIEDKIIFVCTKDIRLKESFEKHQNIVVIQDFEEFSKHSITILFDDYFIEKLKNEVDKDITYQSLKEYEYNLNGNLVINVDPHIVPYLIQIESGEILSWSYKANIDILVEYFVNSGSFEGTHKAIENLLPNLPYLLQSHIEEILTAANENDQIHWIIKDPDVNGLINKLYSHKKGLLTAELESQIEELLAQ